jgi:hypothetical protein
MRYTTAQNTGRIRSGLTLNGSRMQAIAHVVNPILHAVHMVSAAEYKNAPVIALQA